MRKARVVVFLFLVGLFSCQKKEDPKPVDQPTTPVNICPTCNLPDTMWITTEVGPKLIFKFRFDSTQVRLNNFGQPSTVAAGNAAQSPRFNSISAHYIEMAKDDITSVGNGAVLYKAEETTCGGANAIVFCKSILCSDGSIFFSMPLSKVSPGSYKWLRVSLAYQNYDVKIKTNSTGTIDGTLASFVGFNTYVSRYQMKGSVMTPSLNGGPGNKLQGYWGFYTKVFNTEVKTEGQAPQTTVVNPNPSSPIPPGSCLVTGEFYKNSQLTAQPLSITGNETQDIIVEVFLSTNKSFEWKEITSDGLFQPDIGENVVDMGLRGMIPKY